MSGADRHPGQPFVGFHNLRHIFKVKLGIHAVHKQIHGKRHDIHIPGTFAVAEQRSLNTVGAGQQCKLGIRNTAAAVIVRMQRNLHRVPIF